MAEYPRVDARPDRMHQNLNWNMEKSIMFYDFYRNSLAREGHGSHNLPQIALKAFIYSGGTYTATESEFYELYGLCRKMAALYPEALQMYENVSYDDPPSKVIGTHAFGWKLRLSEAKQEKLYQWLANPDSGAAGPELSVEDQE